MARLRQLYPGNYKSPSNVSVEFENVVRYLNAAELGNKTIGELLQQLFDDEGVFDGPISFRFNSSTGLEYRIGEYTDPEEGWELAAEAADLRGPPGVDVGTIQGPLFYNRLDATAGDAQTVINYNSDLETDDVVVYINGLLLPTAEYTWTATQITLASPLTLGDTISVYSVRKPAVTTYRREDILTLAGQYVFGFAHTPDDKLMVFRNGVLQREGGIYDYTTSSTNDTVTFTTPMAANELVTILVVDNQALTDVGGLMMEDEYTGGNGLIDWTKIDVDDGQIPQTKINGLAAVTGSAAKMTVSATSPVSPVVGNLWLDTSVAPNLLKFYDGVQWLRATPETALPQFTNVNANQYLRVNSGGTGLEYAQVDLSSRIPMTYIGAANGVASLDSLGRLPETQLPEIGWPSTVFYAIDTPTAATFTITRFYRQRVRIVAHSRAVGAGSCNIQFKVNGTNVGIEYGVSTALQEVVLAPEILVDASSATKILQVTVSAVSGASNLQLAIAIENLEAV